ncbi:hypothetical protein RI129_012378 [Pyrocoelia pectoralis]|uniref:BTB domain-containing protein n=1 Tax=Pyrocoelia pectoralis TaxID=417401 RepID=A0AAN7UZ58_9COLE
MNDSVEIIRSNKGGLKLIHRGYMYTVHKKRQGGGIRWRCTQRSLHCKGSISTGSGPPSVNMPHNHIPDPHSVALARCRQVEDFPDISSMLETECDDDAIPLPHQRTSFHSPQLQTPTTSDTTLQSEPLSPTKLKVLRRSNNKCYSNKSPLESRSESISHSPEEVCLRWNSHHSNMQNSFPKLLEKEQYVDVTLIAEGHILKCHRMILSSCSAYFDDILCGIAPTQHPVIILRSTPFWVLRALIDFMYAGEVNIDQCNLPELLDAAELLKVPYNLISGRRCAGDPNSKQSISKNNQPAKVEKMPISDPLELLQPKFLEDPNMKNKEKSFPRKLFTKKIRKRKSSDDESASPPLFPMRRGTRSRPNVKVPRYYDYEDIVKPSTSDSQSYSPDVTIKSEPPDIDDNEGTYSEDNSDTKVTIKPKIVEKKQPKTDEMKPEQLYKIKIKCLASLSENSTCESTSNSDNNRKCDEIDSNNKLLAPLELDTNSKNSDILNALEIIKIDCKLHDRPKTTNDIQVADADSSKNATVEIINSNQPVLVLENNNCTDEK